MTQQQFLGEIHWLGAMDTCSDKCEKDFKTNWVGMLSCFAQCNLSSGTPPVAPPGGVTIPAGWTLPKGWTLPSGLPIPANSTVPGLPGIVIPPGFTLPTSLTLPFDWKLLFPLPIPAGAPLPTPPACPAGTMWLQLPGLPGTCVPTSPPPGWFPPTGMPTAAPAQAAINCVTTCESQFGMLAPGGLNPVELANCLTKCAQAANPATIPGGGGQPPPGGGGGQQPPPPPPPGGGGAAPAASSSGSGWLIAGAIGVAVIGVIALAASGKSEQLALNPRGRPRMPRGYADWISKVADLMNASRPHPVEYENVNVDWWRQLYSQGWTPKEAVDALNNW